MVIGKKAIVLVLLLLILFLPLAVAHEESPMEKSTQLKSRTLYVILGASLLVTILTILALSSFSTISERMRWTLFLGIAIPVLLATFYAAGTTIYLNAVSHSAGPVHWHADFEIWNCGEKVELADPSGLSNRMGSPVFHEHNDNRLHIEGVVVNKEEAELEHFFEFVGGKLTGTSLLIPTNSGIQRLQHGELCNGQPGELQAFLYRVRNPFQKPFTYEQVKLHEFSHYIPSPHALVPPGDCLIIEFAEEKEHTEKLCASYAAAIARGELHGS